MHRYVVWRLLPFESGKVFLCLAGLFFYATWFPPFVTLLLSIGLINYLAARGLRPGSPSGKKRLTAAIAMNLGLLFFFKYSDFLIGSINGSRGKRGTSAYAASKAGLIGLARSVSREVGRFGVTANVIEPGYARTPLTESLDPQVLATALAETQLGELVEPDDVAAAVVFLCGPGGRRITGQILRVDSGQHM